jgi:hypothetical protein
VTRFALRLLAQGLAGVAMFGATAAWAGADAGHGAPVMHTPWLGLRFVQDGREAGLVNTDSYTTQVRLARHPFTIMLPTRGADDTYRITAWSDESIFAEAADNVQETRRDPPSLPAFFAPGTGLADTGAGSGTLMLDNEAHHYLEGLRLGPDPKQHLYFVSQVFRRNPSGDAVTIPIKAQKKPIYLVAFLDENGDHSMQNGEYEFIVLNFGGARK